MFCVLLAGSLDRRFFVWSVEIWAVFCVSCLLFDFRLSCDYYGVSFVDDRCDDEKEGLRDKR